MSDETQAAIAAHQEREQALEAQRTKQMAWAGGVGAVSGWQLLDQAKELAQYYWPNQPEILWGFIFAVVAFLLGGGFNRIIRGMEL